jgi:hypothetical protein
LRRGVNPEQVLSIRVSGYLLAKAAYFGMNAE